MFFEQQEADITTQLTSYINAITGYVVGSIIIQPMPENESEFNRVYEKPALEPCYADSEFEKPGQVSPIVSQDETDGFQIMVRSRTLRGPLGIYDLLEKSRLALIGFKPTSCQEGLYLVRINFHDGNSKTEFRYVMHFKVQTTIAQDYTEPIGPTVTSITYDPTIIT